MKVLLVVNSDIGRGNTIGTRFTHVARALGGVGDEVTIFARANYTNDLKVTVPAYQNYFARALKVFRLYIFPWLTFRALDVWLFDRFTLRALRAQKETRFDVAHFGEPCPRSIAYLRTRGVKIVLDMPIGHFAYRTFLETKGIRVGVERDPELRALNQAIERVDTIIAPSPFVVETLHLAGFSSKDIRVVPFGVTAQTEFSHEDLVRRSNETELLFLFAGNVNYRKGIPYLLDAWEKAGVQNGKLIIAGRVFKEIRYEIGKRSLHNVEFLGFVDLKEYYKKAHVFVFPTLLEGSAKAVYEAMSYGLTVIATSNAGSVITPGEDGYLVPIADVDALAKEIQRVESDRATLVSLGEKAMATASQYPWSRYATGVIDVYQSLVHFHI